MGRRGEDDFAVVLERLPDPVLVVAEDGVLRYANLTSEKVFGWARRDVLGTNVLEMIHPDDLMLAAGALETIGDKEVGELIEVRARTGTGGWKTVEVRGAPHQTMEGERLTVLMCRDTSDRHRLELDSGRTDVLRSVMNNMHGMVALVGADAKVRSINGAVTRILGHDPEVAVGRPFASFVHPDDRPRVIDLVAGLAPFESVSLDARFVVDPFLAASSDPGPDGETLTCEFTVNNLVDDPVVQAYIVSGHAGVALTDARVRVEFLADHDNRTGLLNRDGFMRAAADLLERASGLGILIVDLVQFRAINELYGERAGDAVLTTVAERIREIRWPESVSARLGGDEFVVAVGSVSDAGVEMLGERVRREVAQPVLVDGHEINVGVRIATARGEAPEAVESLLTSASSELMRIKRNADPTSGGLSVDVINERRRQLDQLRDAIDSGEVQPFFQPIVTADGLVTAVEALVRWVHPVRGVLGVKDILPLAKMAGLIDAVDRRVMSESLDFAARLADLGHGEIEVHVNVDPKLISRPAFAVDFLEQCAQRGARPGQVVVELTETDLLAPGAAALDNMQELRRAGIHVSIDDFGTGYSSLSHLLELPVDGVKIDRRFVAGIDVDRAATNLTTAILGLSESLQLGCVAEGVEQPYQRDRLAALGCNAFQGWLFSEAVSPDELIALLPRLEAVPVSVDA